MPKPPLTEITHPCPRPPAAVVFDLDGTLVDSGPAIVASYNAGLKATGHRPLRTHDILSMLGLPLDQLYAKRIPAEHVPQACDAYRAEFARLCAAHIAASPGAVALLEQLRAAGVKTAVCTNRARHTREILDQCGLTGLVDAVVDLAEEAYPPKPDPAMLYATMDKVDAIPAETCFIGDSQVDMQAGKAANVWTIGIQTMEPDAGALEAAGAHVVTADLTALPRVLGLVREPEPVAVAVEAPAAAPETPSPAPDADAAPAPDPEPDTASAAPVAAPAESPAPVAPEPAPVPTPAPDPEPAPPAIESPPAYPPPPTQAPPAPVAVEAPSSEPHAEPDPPTVDTSLTPPESAPPA